jgi:hypothetical protein
LLLHNRLAIWRSGTPIAHRKNASRFRGDNPATTGASASDVSTDTPMERKRSYTASVTFDGLDDIVTDLYKLVYSVINFGYLLRVDILYLAHGNNHFN